MSILLRISSLYPSLNDAERKVADAILRDAVSARALSITRLGELSGVSQTTVNRFCRAVGYDGYSDFKLALVEDLVPQRRLPETDTADGSRTESLADLVQNVLSLDMEAIRDTMENLDMPLFGLAVDALVGARLIETVGVGSSLPVAMDLSYRFMRSGLQCRFSSDSHMQAINASLLGPGDVAVAVSYSGETQDTLDAIELAAEAGATTLCLTSFPQSSLASRCTICLLTSTKKTFWLNEAITTRLAQLALCDALCVAVSRQKHGEIDPVLARMEKSVARKRRRERLGTSRDV